MSRKLPKFIFSLYNRSVGSYPRLLRSIHASLPVCSFLLLIPQATLGQGAGQGGGYHFSTGNNRVIMQSQTGLTRPSDTYIGAGTVSQTARGLAPATSHLPSSSWGSVIGTGGDATYMATEKFGHEQTVRANTIPIPNRNYRNKAGVDAQSTDVHYVVRRGKRGRLYYIPVRGFPKQPGNLYQPTGPATYGDSGQTGSGTLRY